ncbi:MAG: tryptophan synthase subunit beta like protein [Gammaproteobacteria bacterium]|nr:MAG: tryptophan synthase subunit beta like protein [Gammaproteobacteria bacterium]
MFVKRNHRGEIVAVSKVQVQGIADEIRDDSPELSSFFGETLQRELAALHVSDLDMIRVLEDIVDLLIGKGVITFTDFPDAVQRKLRARQTLRKTMQDLVLIDEDDETI